MHRLRTDLLTSSPTLNDIAQVYPTPAVSARNIQFRDKTPPPPTPNQLAFLACKCPHGGQASLSVIHLVHWCTVVRAILVLVCDSLSFPDMTLPAAVAYAAPCADTTQKLVIEKIVAWMTTLRRYMLSQGYTWQPTLNPSLKESKLPLPVNVGLGGDKVAVPAPYRELLQL